MSPAGPSSGPAAAENAGLDSKTVSELPQTGLPASVAAAAVAAAAAASKGKSKGKAPTAAVASSASSRTVPRLRGFKWRRALGSCWGSGNAGGAGSADGVSEGPQQLPLPPLQPAGPSRSSPTAVAKSGSPPLPPIEVARNGSPPLPPPTVTRKLTALQLGVHDSAMLLDELLGATTHVIHCAAR